MNATAEQNPLKAAAERVLERNQRRNTSRNGNIKQRNFDPQNQPEKLRPADEQIIENWLDHVGEHDLSERRDILSQCRDSLKTRAFYLSQAQTIGAPANVVPITQAPTLADCSSCKHQIRSSVNPEGGLSYCQIRRVPMQLPSVPRRCGKHEEC